MAHPGHQLTREDRIAGGYASKRPKTIKTQLEQIMYQKAPVKIVESLKQNGLIVEDDSLANVTALTLIAKALEGEQWATKLILEHLDGRPAETMQLNASITDNTERVNKLQKLFSDNAKTIDIEASSD